MNVTLSNLMSFVVLNLLSPKPFDAKLACNFLAQNGVEVRPELPKLTKMVRGRDILCLQKGQCSSHLCMCKNIVGSLSQELCHEVWGEQHTVWQCNRLVTWHETWLPWLSQWHALKRFFGRSQSAQVSKRTTPL